VRVLVVGQDPYPTPGHPIGLSFAVDAHVGQRAPERPEDVVAGRGYLPAAISSRRKTPIAAIRSSTGASASAQSGAIRPLSTSPLSAPMA